MGFLRDGTISPELREQLLRAPFDYQLIDSENPSFGKDGPIVYNTFGCPENDDPKAIQAVGYLAEGNGQKAAFGVLLGDNNNPSGVTDKNDPIFKTNFHKVHGKVTFAILGNHDKPEDDEKALAQILHTFVDLDTGKWDTQKINCWFETNTDGTVKRRETVDLAELRKAKNNWNMPGRYGVLRAGHTNFFVTDSTNLGKEFCEHFLSKQNKNPNQQAAWLFQAPKASTAIHKILLQHHPLYDFVSKRNILSDHPDYLSPALIAELAKVGIKGNHSEIFHSMYFLAGNPDTGLPVGPGYFLTEAEAAHYHGSNYRVSNNSSILEVLQTQIQFPAPLARLVMSYAIDSIPHWISGSAGGPPQETFGFSDYANLVFNTTDRGFMQRELFPNGDSQGTLYTLTDHCLKVRNGKIVKELREEKIAAVEQQMLSACREFQGYLAQHPLYHLDDKGQMQYLGCRYIKTGKIYPWLPHFYEQSDAIQNFLNRYQPSTLEVMQNHLRNALEKSQEDPKKQYDAYWNNQSYMMKAIVHHPEATYFPTLQNHQNTWIQIFDGHLKTAFSMQYDQFIHSAIKPVSVLSMLLGENKKTEVKTPPSSQPPLSSEDAQIRPVSPPPEFFENLAQSGLHQWVEKPFERKNGDATVTMELRSLARVPAETKTQPVAPVPERGFVSSFWNALPTLPAFPFSKSKSASPKEEVKSAPKASTPKLATRASLSVDTTKSHPLKRSQSVPFIKNRLKVPASAPISIPAKKLASKASLTYGRLHHSMPHHSRTCSLEVVAPEDGLTPSPQFSPTRA